MSVVKLSTVFSRLNEIIKYTGMIACCDVFSKAEKDEIQHMRQRLHQLQAKILSKDSSARF